MTQDQFHKYRPKYLFLKGNLNVSKECADHASNHLSKVSLQMWPAWLVIQATRRWKWMCNRKCQKALTPSLHQYLHTPAIIIVNVLCMCSCHSNSRLVSTPQRAGHLWPLGHGKWNSIIWKGLQCYAVYALLSCFSQSWTLVPCCRPKWTLWCVNCISEERDSKQHWMPAEASENIGTVHRQFTHEVSSSSGAR
jgi:hypothetical protein